MKIASTVERTVRINVTFSIKMPDSIDDMDLWKSGVTSSIDEFRGSLMRFLEDQPLVKAARLVDAGDGW